MPERQAGAVIPLPDSLHELQPVVVDDLVRLGKSEDGGYVLPESVLRRTDGLLSFGLSTDWSFEQDFAERMPNRPIEVYDHTVGREAFRKMIAVSLVKAATLRGSMAEILACLRIYAGYGTFFRNDRRHYAERVYSRPDQVYDVTLATIFGRVSNLSNLMVKMDIEGGEYRVIDSLLEFRERVPLITAEFHDTGPLRELFLSKIHSILQWYHIVHLHGNNFSGRAADGLPECLEITFVRKDLIAANHRRDTLPLKGLDFPCNPQQPDYELRFV